MQIRIPEEESDIQIITESVSLSAGSKLPWAGGRFGDIVQLLRIFGLLGWD